MQRCKICDWAIETDERCVDRKKCGQRQLARTDNQKAKMQGLTRERYQVKKSNKLWHAANPNTEW